MESQTNRYWRNCEQRNRHCEDPMCIAVFILYGKMASLYYDRIRSGQRTESSGQRTESSGQRTEKMFHTKQISTKHFFVFFCCFVVCIHDQGALCAPLIWRTCSSMVRGIPERKVPINATTSAGSLLFCVRVCMPRKFHKSQNNCTYIWPTNTCGKRCLQIARHCSWSSGV